MEKEHAEQEPGEQGPGEQEPEGPVASEPPMKQKLVEPGQMGQEAEEKSQPQGWQTLLFGRNILKEAQGVAKKQGVETTVPEQGESGHAPSPEHPSDEMDTRHTGSSDAEVVRDHIAMGIGTLEEKAMRFFGRADAEDYTPGKADKTAKVSPLATQLRDALASAEEHRNAYLDAVEEMQGFRKRYERDSQQNRQFAIESFARDLLFVADNLERALAAMPEESSPEFKAMQDGVLMIQNELNRVFGKHGVVRIEALHTPFDPNVHQAVMHVEEANAQPGEVIREMQTGYLLNGRLLRPAMVGVAKEPA